MDEAYSLDYDEADAVGARTITAGQWARAQAARALLATGHPIDTNLADEVNRLAELIISGSLPD